MEFSSAGTFVCAALETAGYLTQASFLEHLQPFFQGMGALLYVCTAMFAMISVALFGNYKMGRYLLLGPFLYITAIGYTTESDGVVWRMGNNGRVRRIVSTDLVAEKGASDIATIASEDGLQELYSVREGDTKGREPIKISGIFHIYTSIISNIVNTFVDLIIQIKDRPGNDDRLLINQMRGTLMDSLTRISPESAKLVNMIQTDLMGPSCGDMTMSALSLANGQYQKSSIEKVQQSIAGEDSDIAAGVKRNLEMRLAQSEKEISEFENKVAEIRARAITPSADTLDFMESHLDSSATKYSQGTHNAIDEFCKNFGACPIGETRYTAEVFSGYKGGMVLTCQATYKVILDAILEDAEQQVLTDKNRILPKNISDDKKLEYDQELCREISYKLGGQSSMVAEVSCDLGRVYAIFLLRNAISQGGMSKQAQRIKNQMRGLPSTGKATKDHVRPAVSDDRHYTVESEKVGPDGNTYYTFRYNGQPEGELYKDPLTGKTEFSQHDVVGIGGVKGPLEVLSEQQKFQGRGLLQKIFSYSLRLPYMQGVLLYLLGAAYPFLSLVLLFPEKAASFFLMPLMWLWIKSWDIGFAAVMVLEQTLWNLFPHTDVLTDFEKNLIGPQGMELTDILTESMQVDFTYHTHAYLMMTHMALTAVPVLTGYAILRSKQGILATFSSALSESNQSGNAISSAFGTNMINRMLQDSKLLAAGNNVIATRIANMPASEWMGVRDEPVHQRSKHFGALAALGNVVESSFNGANASKTTTGMITAGTNATKDMFAAQFARELGRIQFGRGGFGRYGRYRQMLEARGSAVDAGLGFEITDGDQVLTYLGRDSDRFVKELGSVWSFEGQLKNTLAKKINEFPGKSKALPNAAMFGAFGSSLIDPVKIAQIMRAENPEERARLMREICESSEISEEELESAVNAFENLKNGKGNAGSILVNDLASGRLKVSAFRRALMYKFLGIDPARSKETVSDEDGQSEVMEDPSEPSYYLPPEYEPMLQMNYPKHKDTYKGVSRKPKESNGPEDGEE